MDFLIQSYPGNTGNLFFSNFPISWKYWKLKSATFSIYPGNTGGGRAAPGVVLCCLGLFLERVPGKMNMVTLQLRSKQALFWKLLPRPNYYAHKTWIEILCRTPVSILKYLSPRPQNHMKNSKYSFLAWMSTWIPRWRRRRRRRRPNNSPIWPDPWTITPRDQISRSGSIPHFDFRTVRCSLYVLTIPIENR